jgi:hypothetical protein
MHLQHQQMWHFVEAEILDRMYHSDPVLPSLSSMRMLREIVAGFAEKSEQVGKQAGAIPSFSARL